MTTRNVSATASNPMRSWMRMPASAASEQPSAQLSDESRAGRVPLRRASERSSTTARIDTPVRVPNRKTRRPAATATASTMAMSWWYVTPTPNTMTLLPPKKAWPA